MLKKLLQFFKNKEAVLDTVNIILGLLMLTALVVFWKTGGGAATYIIIFCGGAMNLSNGYRYLQRKEKKQMGYSMILFGFVVIVLDVVLLVI